MIRRGLLPIAGSGGVVPVRVEGATSAVGTNVTLTTPSAAVGDWLVVINAGRARFSFSDIAPPSLLSGYTNIGASGNAQRPLRVQYKEVTSAGTENITVAYYGLAILISGADSVGQVGINTSDSGATTYTLATLTGLGTTNSLILGGSYFPGTTTSNDISSASLHNVEAAVHEGGPSLNAFVSIEDNTNSSISGATVTQGASITQTNWHIEIKGA